MKLKRMII